MGYEAFKKTKQYRTMNSFLDESRPTLFLGYAFAWMVDDRPEAIANQVRSNEFQHCRPSYDRAESHSAKICVRECGLCSR